MTMEKVFIAGSRTMGRGIAQAQALEAKREFMTRRGWYTYHGQGQRSGPADI